MYLEGQHEALPALLEVICRRSTVAKCAITAPLRNLTVQELISGRSVSDESLQRRLDAAEQALSTLNTRQVSREAFSPRLGHRSRQIGTSGLRERAHLGGRSATRQLGAGAGWDGLGVCGCVLLRCQSSPAMSCS
jgi:hypothetical protein